MVNVPNANVPIAGQAPPTPDWYRVLQSVLGRISPYALTILDDVDAEAVMATLGIAQETATLADDAAVSFTPPFVGGTIIVGPNFNNDFPQIGYGGIAAFDTGSSVGIAKWAGGANFNVTTGALSGTTGTDAKVTLSAHTDGKLYLENRFGSALPIRYTIL